MTQTVVVAADPTGVRREPGREPRTTVVTAVAEAIAAGAGIVLPPELFEGRYFCQFERQEFFSWATTTEENPAIRAVQKVTAGTGAVVPVSFFEDARPAYLQLGGHRRGRERAGCLPEGTHSGRPGLRGEVLLHTG